MPVELQAYDGGQEYRLRLGEIQTIAWKLDPIEVMETLSGAGIDAIDAGLSAVLASIDTTTVSYRFTASAVGLYDVVVSLNMSSGDKKIHRLVIEVFE